MKTSHTTEATPMQNFVQADRNELVADVDSTPAALGTPAQVLADNGYATLQRTSLWYPDRSIIFIHYCFVCPVKFFIVLEKEIPRADI